MGDIGELTRADVVQHMLDITEGKTYLEIGVHTGETFFPMRAKRKIAVDPLSPVQAGLSDAMQRPADRATYRALITAAYQSLRPQAGEQYIRKTSDEFFAQDAPKLLQDGIDVAFIDGLHTHTQSLKDLENCLKYLNPKGVIVLHDCSPTNWAMAYPARSFNEARSDVHRINATKWTGEWCGDVWKTPVYLRSRRPDLEVVVLDTDYGVGIVRRGTPQSMLDFSREEIALMPYETLEANRRAMLNLKSPHYLSMYSRRDGELPRAANL